jgi:hypothetical protein
VDNYKRLIDSTELQQKVLDYIASEEFNKMVDSTVFRDDNQCKLAIIHGMAIASMLTCRCKPLYINFKKEDIKHGHWFALDECANEGVYCSVCCKKVYKLNYANQKLKSKYCPNCGAIMDEKDITETDKNDDRPQCCKDHDKYFSTCDTCEFGE